MSEVNKGPVENRTGVEKVVAAIWSHALGVPYVGNDDNFFELGGDIALARRLAEQIRSFLEMSISSDAIIEYPTVKELAQAMEAANRRAAGHSGLLPLTDVEKYLLEIWYRVLGIDNIGLHDNFFKLGGNSLLAIRVATEARQQGFDFAGRDLFQYQTIAELAPAIKLLRSQQVEGREQGLRYWPLTPIQMWLLEQNLGTPNVWNVSLMLRIDEGVDQTILPSAIRRLLRKHDALRLQFVRRDNKWMQYLNEEDDKRTFECFDLSNFAVDEQGMQLLQICASLHQSIVFGDGLLVRFALIHLGSPGRRFLIIAHHLVCDGLSLQILADDLANIYKSDCQDKSASDELPQNSHFLDWAVRINNKVVLQQALTEQAYWAPRRPFRLPVDLVDGENLMGSAEFLQAELEPEETAALVSIARDHYRTSIETMLLWGSASAIMSWAQKDSITFNVVGHGRETEWKDINLYKTVGWLNVHYPITFDFPPDLNLPAAIRIVLHCLNCIPNHGFGFGILKYLYNSTDHPILLEEDPEFGFNYLGDYDAMFEPNGIFELANEHTGLGRDPNDKSTFKLGLFCSIRNKRIRLNWFFNRKNHHRKTIEALNADVLARIRSACKIIDSEVTKMP